VQRFKLAASAQRFVSDYVGRANRVGAFWGWLCTQARQRSGQIGLAFRVTVAALLALVLAQSFDLPLPLWAALTAVIVTQMSVGHSLKASTDYLIGTLGGAVYGGAIAVLIPHSSEAALLAVLAIAIAPLALVAAIRSNFAVGPFTAITVLLVPTMTHASPLDSAIYRVLEVAVGAITGLLVSFLIFPSSAHRQLLQVAAQTLDLMAQALGELPGSRTRGLDIDIFQLLQDGIDRSLAKLDATGAEAKRERAAHLSAEPDPGPLSRTLLRLRHDLISLGRATAVPLPDGSALATRRVSPSLEAVDRALEIYSAEVAALRQEGLTISVPTDDAERFFAIGFALEQMHQNFRDLVRVVAEWKQVPKDR
jgi:uncharacterized membrane protein YccC